MPVNNPMGRKTSYYLLKTTDTDIPRFRLGQFLRFRPRELIFWSVAYTLCDITAMVFYAKRSKVEGVGFEPTNP
jgi:hypothetical protein